MQNSDLNEPLLKDEEEKFPFLEESKNENKKDTGKKKNILITVVIAIIILVFFGRMVYAFYIGFKYYDLRYEDTLIENTNKEKISLDSIIIKETYSKINLAYENATHSLINRFYNGNVVNANELENEEKLALIFSNISNLNCDNPEAFITYDQLSTISKNLFNETSVVEALQNIIDTTYDNFVIIYNEIDDNYKITLMTCPIDNQDFIIRHIESAYTEDDELYIYEKFGYFKIQSENTYNVLETTLSKNPLSIYTDITGTKEFTDYSILKTFIWTFKKGSDNSYYFVSLTPA